MTEHSHHVVAASSAERKLAYGLALTGFILVLEVAGGLLSNSLALLSDAGHVFADLVALSLSLYGVRQARRSSSSRMTFGYHRVGVIIAIVNALSIFAIAGVILYKASGRFAHPLEVKSMLMLSIAVVGLAANIFVAWWLRAEQRNNLNVRSAFWHAMGDALASAGVIIGGLVMLVTGWFRADPVVSVLIGAILVVAAWRILREGLRVLLEATPSGVDVMDLIAVLQQIPAVKDVHDIHVWSISPEFHALSCHVLIDDLSTSQAAEIRERIESMVRQQFSIRHTTLQMECEKCEGNEIFCNLTLGSGDEKPTTQ